MSDMSLNGIIDLLARSSERGIKITYRDEDLIVRIPDRQEADPAILAEIKQNKEDLKRYFKVYHESPDTTLSVTTITAADRTGDAKVPLSFAQERIWLADQKEGGTAYHLPIILRLKGKLNEPAIHFAINGVINRHEALRTVFVWREGELCQQVLDVDSWALQIVAQGDNLQAKIDEMVGRRFDLSKDHPLRAMLCRSGDEEFTLVVVLHHIAADAWSGAILIEEVTELYNSFCAKRLPNLSPLPIQYSDYAIWQRRHLDGEVYSRKLDYWRYKLAGLSPLALPTDSPRSAAQGSEGRVVSRTLPADLADKLSVLSRDQGMTLFMVLLSALKVLLYRYANQKDICILSSIAGRQQQEVEPLIGFFANTLILRDEISGSMSVRQLFAQIKKTTLDAYENQEVPFEKVIELSGLKRESDGNPISQVMFVLENVPEASGAGLNGVRLQGRDNSVLSCKFDLTFNVSQSARGLQMSLMYRQDLYRTETAAKMLQHFANLLSGLISGADPCIYQLNMLSPAEFEWISGRFGLCTVDYPAGKTVVDLFLDQVKKTPEATALVFGEESITYSNLHRRALRVASYLRQKGVREDMPVPVCMERSIEMIVGIVGVLLAGGAYVPVEPDLPKERIRQMLDDIDPVTVLTADRFNEIGEDLVEFDLELRPDHLIYVIYTSGSTGKPKGVMIEHRNVIDYVYGVEERTGIQKSKSFALVSTISADLGNTVIFTSLLSGGELHILSRAMVTDAAGFCRYFREHRIDCLKIVPSHWTSLCLSGEMPLPWQMLIFGGEPLPSEIPELIRAARPTCTVINHYGPTETTIGKLLYVASGEGREPGPIPIGRPFSNSTVRILSADGTLCPTGVPGELYIGGSGLARGYWKRDDLTAEKFVKDPCGSGNHTRLYRTGDLVRWRPDGNIEYCGRIDNQVKVNGYRIELEEIEQVINEDPQVMQCAVVAKAVNEVIKRLVAYVVFSGNEPESIQQRLQNRLPAYMVPSIVLVPDHLPLTANGKIDRRELSRAYSPDLPEDRSEGPRNRVEHVLTEIVKQLLGTGSIFIRDDFFGRGGHSLLAIRYVSAIRSALGVEVSIGDIFDYPTIESLAERIGQRAGEKLMPGMVAGDRPERIPLSFSQERLWVIDQLEGSLQYHIPIVLRVSGTLDESALSYALTQVIERHDVLRTVIDQYEDQPFQRVLPVQTWALQTTDYSSGQNGPAGLQELIKAQINRRFDLSKDHKMRATLIRLDSGDYVLTIVLHHIASDGWSTAILVEELAELYISFVECRAPRLKPLTIQYADYAIWQRENIKAEVLEQKLAYWKQRLSGMPVLELPTDRTRPTIQSTRGKVHIVQIDRKLTDRLSGLSHDHGVTLFMTLLAAFKVLLHRYSGQDDIAVGVPVSSRTMKEVEGLIGFFINTLVLRCDLGGDPGFEQLLQQVKQVTLEGYEHQDVPFERVVDAVVTERDTSRSPLFTVMFVLQNMPQAGRIRIGNIMLKGEPMDHTTSKFDLSIGITENSDGMEMAIEYCTDLFEKETIDRMGDHYKQLLLSVVERPEQKISALELLSEAERKRLATFNPMRAGYPEERTVVDLIGEQAARKPDATAVIYSGECLSYRELEERSNRLAHYLREQGVGEETLVPICTERSLAMILGILGILKAGGAYVPLDPDHPADRLSYMLGETKATVVVTTRELSALLPVGDEVRKVLLDEEWAEISRQPAESVMHSIRPGNLAYVIYTSGSTGRPKGVMIEHKGVINLIVHEIAALGITSDEKILQFYNYCFDASAGQIFLALCSGSTLVLMEDEIQMDLKSLADLIIREDITHFDATPGYLGLLPPGRYGKLKRVVAGGERCPLSLAVAWSAYVDFFNAYGPTEATITATEYLCSAVPDGGILPIGRPVANTFVYILDKNDRLCPIGVRGELCIGGVQVARGYLGQPELTANAFFDDPFDPAHGSRLYRTGDAGRWLPDGNIEYLGRQDEQVKISGFRIELGEIENELRQSGEIAQCALMIDRADPAQNRLAAYIVPSGNWNKKAMIDHLRSRLPGYMIPSIFVTVPYIPLTANGKLDRRALTELSPGLPGEGDMSVVANETEAKILAVWKELLGVNTVDIRENLFQQGGNSLLLLRLARRLSIELNKEIRPIALFEYPTIRSFAQYITTV